MTKIFRFLGAIVSLIASAFSRGRPRKPFVSLVAMLPETLAIDEAMLAAALERSRLDAGVVGEVGSIFVVTLGDLGLIVTHKEGLYGDPAAAPADLTPALKKTVADHRAALMVDLLRSGDEVDPDRAYPVIGSLLAEIAPLDCVIYWPDGNRFAPLDVEAKALLRGGAPLLAFAKRDQKDITDVTDDHPKLKAAEQEAKARWGDFVEAFENRSRSEAFMVKAYFRYGDRSEAMWVRTESIDEQTISGELDNEPRDILNLRKGDRVTFSLDDLSDWAYLKDGEMLGGFTLKVLKELAGTEGNVEGAS